MAELAIHDPHYFNVESEQKTAIVHLFHNPIPADGPREEGPEWARNVDDIYLIGGVGPDGPTVKTVVNDEVTEWSKGGGQNVDFTLTNNTSNSGQISTVCWDDTHNCFIPRFHYFSSSDSVWNGIALIQDGMITFTSTRSILWIKINGVEIVYDQVSINTSLYLIKFPMPDSWDGTMEVRW